MNKRNWNYTFIFPFAQESAAIVISCLPLPRSRQGKPIWLHFCRDRGRAKDYSDRTVTSIFIGGGTPSLLSGEQIGQLMDRIREQFAMAQDAGDHHGGESGDGQRRNFGIFTAGINRLSIRYAVCPGRRTEKSGQDP